MLPNSNNKTIDLWLDVTDKCNKACETCPRKKDYSIPERNYINTEDRIEIISRLDEYLRNNKDTKEGIERGYGPIERVHLSGGEPLLEGIRAETFEIADYCRSKGMEAIIYTNGDALLQGLEMEELYKHADNVLIGIHDIDKLPDLMDVALFKKPEDKQITFNIIADKKNSETIIKYSKIINQHAGLMCRKRISIRYYDRVPINDVKDIALEKDSDVMERLYRDTPEIIRDYKTTKENYWRALPSKCEDAKNTITVDAYGNLRHCTGVYGPKYGNLLTEDIGKCLKRKNEQMEIFEIYDLHAIPFLTAKEHAKEQGIIFKDNYRIYCTLVLEKLFDMFDNAEEMVRSFEETLSETEPLAKEYIELIQDNDDPGNDMTYQNLPTKYKRLLQNFVFHNSSMYEFAEQEKKRASIIETAMEN